MGHGNGVNEKSGSEGCDEEVFVSM